MSIERDEEIMNRPFHATKFRTEFVSEEIPKDRRVDELRFWCSEFHRFNLAPLHKYGACGNLSFRLAEGEIPFIVTASGTSFDGTIPGENFVAVQSCDLDKGVVYAEGAKRPSSESMFHFALYDKRRDVNAVFHGHSPEILSRAQGLNLVETEREEPYGSVELVRSILNVLNNQLFVVIKNHGFISLGGTMKEAGERALNIYKRSL
jgi:ribulose-5-phosphate 4-epimerase/fuculose-1-phosphate aldolase